MLSAARHNRMCGKEAMTIVIAKIREKKNEGKEEMKL